MTALMTVLTATALIAGVSAANARGQQATGAELDWQLSHQIATRPVYAFASTPHHRVVVLSQRDFQLEGR